MARKKRRTGVSGPREVPEDPDFDIVDRDEAGQPVLTEAERRRKASGEARGARVRDNTFHARKAKLVHLTDHLPQALWDAFLERAVRPRVKAISERGVIGSLLLGFLVRGFFTLHAADQLDAQGQPLTYTETDIPVSAADIPDLSCRNLFRQLCRGLPGEGERTRPSAAVAAVLAAHPDLSARLEAIPRYLSDSNMVDNVGQQLQTSFSNMLTLLFSGRLKKAVSLAGAMVCGLEVTWLLREGGVVVTAAMQAEVALQRGLLGLEEGEVVNHAWVKDPANRGRLLRHAVHTTREMEASMAAWQLDMVADRWNAFLPNLAAVRPNVGQTFAQVVHTVGLAVSVMFTRPKPAEPPGELPRMGKEEGAVNPLAHLDADWLGCDPGKTNMATVAHEERYPSGAVKSVWQRSLTAGQYYRQSGITKHAKESKEYVATTLWTWPAMWAELSKRRWSNARFRLYGGKQRTVATFWAERRVASEASEATPAQASADTPQLLPIDCSS
ncbi:hypothetical protein QJQ45_014873, partial [Haematococcus lacustris]